ncbi:MAG: hypothetical protein GYB68_12865 [Chloroflexi bacterium]|nr:hypothetical protein [Chloroflexota bacterium]
MQQPRPKAWAVVSLASLLAVMACTGVSLPGLPQAETTPISDDSDDPSDLPEDRDPATDQTPAEGAEMSFPAVGRLIVLGSDGNLTLFEGGLEPRAITSDAERTDDFRRVYLHPTWSPNGWLSYVQLDLQDQSQATVRVLATRPGNEMDPVLLYESMTSQYVYGYWSPAVCENGVNCGRFAYLINDLARPGLDLHLAQVNDEAADDDIIESGGSIYYSWAPSGEELFWFRNSETLAIYDVASDSLDDDVDDDPGRFQAPAWSPLDNRLLFAREDGGINALTIIDGDRQQALGSSVGGAVFFSWSPNGEAVAHVHGQPGQPYSPVVIVSSDGGEETVYSDLSDVLAFFWSPDSSKLAVVTVEPFEAQPQANANGHTRLMSYQAQQPDFVLVWSVIEVETGDIARLASFLPTSEQFYILSFFDQYAQSHRLWSPDSRYLVYAAADPDTEDAEIMLLDTTTPGASPLSVTNGVQAIFTFGE